MTDEKIKLKGADKTARIPIKIVPATERLPKPDWIRAKSPSGSQFYIVHGQPIDDNILNGL